MKDDCLEICKVDTQQRQRLGRKKTLLKKSQILRRENHIKYFCNVYSLKLFTIIMFVVFKILHVKVIYVD